MAAGERQHDFGHEAMELRDRDHLAAVTSDRETWGVQA
jgi:hypothetical protein